MEKSGFLRGFSLKFPDFFVFVYVFDIDSVIVIVFVIVYGIGCNAKYADANNPSLFYEQLLNCPPYYDIIKCLIMGLYTLFYGF